MLWYAQSLEQSLFNALKYPNELLPLTVCVFLVGFLGFIESKEFLSVLVNVEIIMLAINFNLLTNSLLWGDYYGQVYVLCLVSITAAETALGLGILILLYRTKGKIAFDEFSTLKG